MFADQIQALMNAGMDPSQAAILAQCEQDLRHNGRIYLAPNLNPNGTDGALNIRVGKGKKAINITQGDLSVGGDVYFLNNISFNGAGGTSMGFYNNSGEVIPPGGIMDITNDILFRDRQGNQIHYLTVGKPASGEFRRMWAVNGNRPVLDGAFGICSTAGLCLPYYDDAHAPAVNEEWGPCDATWKISQGGYGFHILGTGRDGIVQCEQRVVTHCRVTLTQSLSQGGTATADVNASNGSAFTLTVSDDAIPTGKTIANGSILGVSWENNVWRPNVSSACPT